jgi:hypothetical protein
LSIAIWAAASAPAASVARLRSATVARRFASASESTAAIAPDHGDEDESQYERGTAVAPPAHAASRSENVMGLPR